MFHKMSLMQVLGVKHMGGMSLIVSDIEIVNRCLAGEVNAFEMLIERYKRAIYNTAFRMMGNREEAEDVS